MSAILNLLVSLAVSVSAQPGIGGDGTRIGRGNTIPIMSDGAVGTAGSVIFLGTGGIFAQDNASLFFNDSTNSLAVGDATPDGKFEVQADATVAATSEVLLVSSTNAAGILAVEASGEVGILTTDPAEELHVVGDAIVTEQVSVGTTTMPVGGLKVQGPTAETIAAAGTITANACGSLKEVTAVDDVTTDTTNTLTAPADANDSCVMTLYNVGTTTNTITLDQNANNNLAANVVLGPCDTIQVASNGSRWVFGAVYAGTCN